MSHVTAVVLLYDPGYREAEDVLRDVNAFGFPHGLGLADTTDCGGGTKHPQLHIAHGGFNYLDIPAFLAHLRTVKWGGGWGWADVLIQDEHDNGVGLVNLYRGPEADGIGSPWRETLPREDT